MNRVLAKLSALALVVLILSPFTAPFQTYGLKGFAPGREISDRTAAAACSLDQDDAGSVVTLAPQIVRFKIALEGAFDGTKLSVAPSATVGAHDRSSTNSVTRAADPPIVLRV